ncbi:4-hydroxythreonine-4-phosphate dehydrogenase [Prevotella bivia DNF00188]|uniref:PdxA family dehydrogenase n=1 Tax=Prevotella bivia TaxID=28125 RepID=UPI00050EDD5D|nr:4-hydroxythreonine-4-phosphate dehydrogenase PdxA [Prevotella bivia]KGF22363.1 4-hydroxythreonine-4-phosphate dehydrogenase [Prevotella bivia DNF00188]WIL17684.1 4-hydroxythreonine-4-phosphate dehydrogenase PdxA [Prevotella bivia]
MENNKKLRVAITHGDTNGIGYELIFKTFAEQEILELCTPIIYGSPKVATYHRNALDIEANFTIINDASDIKDGRVNLLPVFDEEIKVELGVATEESGNAGLVAIDRALEDYKQGLFDVLITCPLENNDKFHFSGQSRYINDHLGIMEQGLTVLVNEGMRIALATRNLPLKDVCEYLTKDILVRQTTLLYESLKRDFCLSCPRIALLGINPKAGDNGLLGSEEIELIQPAIEQLAANGIQAFGAYAADTLFGNGDYTQFDAILAMYYEQAFTPFRTIPIGNGINYTAGLSLIRTAPDMPNSLSLAGKNIAEVDAFRNAIYAAIDIYRNRINYDEPLSNPLPKLYKERKEEGEKVRFAVKRNDFSTKGEQGSNEQ